MTNDSLAVIRSTGHGGETCYSCGRALTWRNAAQGVLGHCATCAGEPVSLCMRCGESVAEGEVRCAGCHAELKASIERLRAHADVVRKRILERVAKRKAVRRRSLEEEMRCRTLGKSSGISNPFIALRGK